MSALPETPTKSAYQIEVERRQAAYDAWWKSLFPWVTRADLEAWAIRGATELGGVVDWGVIKDGPRGRGPSRLWDVSRVVYWVCEPGEHPVYIGVTMTDTGLRKRLLGHCRQVSKFGKFLFRAAPDVKIHYIKVNSYDQAFDLESFLIRNWTPSLNVVRHR